MPSVSSSGLRESRKSSQWARLAFSHQSAPTSGCWPLFGRMFPSHNSRKTAVLPPIGGDAELYQQPQQYPDRQYPPSQQQQSQLQSHPPKQRAYDDSRAYQDQYAEQRPYPDPRALIAGNRAYSDPGIDRVQRLETRVNAAESSTRTLLNQALRIQTDIDDAFQVSQDALRSEKQQRSLLKDHIRSITHVVKTLSQELEGTEDRCMASITALKQLVKKSQQDGDDRVGQVVRYQQEQDTINARMKDSMSSFMSQHRAFQDRTTAQLANLSEKMDALTVKVQQLAGIQESQSRSCQQSTSSLSDQSQKLSMQVGMVSSQFEGLTALVQRNERIVKDLERDYTQLDGKFSSMFRDVHAAIVNEHSANTDACLQIEAKVMNAIKAGVGQCNMDIASQSKQLGMWMQDQTNSVSQQLTDIRAYTDQQITQGEQRYAQLQDAHVHDLDQRFQKLSHELEGRFSTFKTSVSSNVTDMHTSMLLLRERVEELHTKIANILKTIVIM